MQPAPSRLWPQPWPLTTPVRAWLLIGDGLVAQSWQRIVFGQQTQDGRARAPFRDKGGWHASRAATGNAEALFLQDLYQQLRRFYFGQGKLGEAPDLSGDAFDGRPDFFDCLVDGLKGKWRDGHKIFPHEN
jgi:hypothetical protein